MGLDHFTQDAQLFAAAYERRLVRRQVAGHVAGGQRCGRRRWRSGCSVKQGRRETIAASLDRGDDIGSEELAQGADLHLHVALFDHQVLPHQVEQLILGDDAIAPLYQGHQQIEGAIADLHRNALTQQPALG